MALIRTLLGCAAALCIAMPVFAAEQTANPNNNNAQQIVIADSKQNATASTAANLTAANSTATTPADAQKATDPKTDANKDMKAATSVNINTASAEELMSVKGIGKKRAEAIIKYREQNGPFKSVEDLHAVKGISKKFIEKNRNQLTIG